MSDSVDQWKIGPGLRSAIVTGGGSGIGRAVTMRFAADPVYAVVSLDIDTEGLAETRRVVESVGLTCSTVVGDVSSSKDCADAIATARAIAPVGLLVNAAGITTAPDSVEEVEDAEIASVWDVNVGSIFRLGRFAIPAMREAGGGVIINVASVHAFASMTDNAVYAASKGAIVALSRQMALDVVADRIRVVAVAPGSIDTPMTQRELARRGLTLEEAGFADDDRSTGRMGQPSELAEVIAWLASPAASLINGTTVVADAGLLARLV